MPMKGKHKTLIAFSYTI